MCCYFQNEKCYLKNNVVFKNLLPKLSYINLLYSDSYYHQSNPNNRPYWDSLLSAEFFPCHCSIQRALYMCSYSVYMELFPMIVSFSHACIMCVCVCILYIGEEKGNPVHYSTTLAWRIPWTVSLTGCSPWGRRVRHN